MPEKIQWEPKKKKDKKPLPPELQKLVPMKIERKEMKPTQLKFVEPTEAVQLATIKLKKTTVPKRRDSTTVKVPKVRLKSRITFISDWPTPLHLPNISIIEENPIQNGILSRNVEEAAQIPTKKYKKKKLPDKEITELEKLDKEFEELKKKPLEEMEDKSIYERPEKPPKEKSDQKPKKLKIGKGEVPEEEEVPEDVKLKKPPAKIEETKEKKPKKTKPEEKSQTKDKEKVTQPEISMEPLEFKPIDIDDSNLEKFIPQEEDKPDKGKPEKKSEKYKRPERKGKDQEIEKIPIEKGVPKPTESEDDTEVKFRIPLKDKPDETPEEIKLKPWTKEEAKPDVDTNIENELLLKPTTDQLDEIASKKPIKKKKKEPKEEETLQDEITKTPENKESIEKTEELPELEQPAAYEKKDTDKPNDSEATKLALEDETPKDLEDKELKKDIKKPKKKKPVKKKPDYEEWVEPEYTPPVLEPMPEKIQWEPKKKKDKKPLPPELQKLIPIKIERKEIKPTQLKFVEPTEAVQLATIKLKKTTVPKRRDSTTIKVPKVRLKSRITFISDWPTPLQLPKISIIEENPIQNGILSRNVEEAAQITTKKYKKKKLPDKEITELEKLDKEFEELKKKPLEEIEDKSVYERPEKRPKEKSDKKPEEIKVGKGEIPEKEEEVPEDIKLKKPPAKTEETKEKKPKKTKPEEKPETKNKEKITQPEISMEPLEFKPMDIDDSNLEKFIPQEEDKPDKEKPEKKPEKYKRPERKRKDQEIEKIPIEKGVPKPDEPDDDLDIKFRIPEKDKPEEIPEEIKLKPWEKKVSEDDGKLEDKKVDEEKVVEQIVEEVKIKKKPKKKPSIEETAEKVTITKPVDDTAELKQPEQVTEDVSLKKKPKKIPVVDESVDELTIKKPKTVEEETVKEEIIEEIKIKKKPKKKPSVEETTEEVTITKPVDDTAELKQPEEVTAEVLLEEKPKKKPIVDESVDELTIKKPKTVEEEKVDEEIVTEVKIKKKPKKKPSVEETTEEVTIIKPVDDTAELKKPEEVTEDVSLKKKPKKIPVVDESVDELTIKKPKTVEEETVKEEIIEEIKIKKKPKKKPSIEETTEEVTITKPVGDTAELKQPEDVTEEISLKKKPKKEPVVDESVDELTIKKPKPVEEERVEEEIVEEVKIKKKPKKKPSVEETTEEVTITKLVDDTAELKQPEEVTAEVSLKKKPKKESVVDESVDELTIKKPKPVEEERFEEEIVEEVKIEKKPKKKPSVEETTEEVTITKLVDDTAELKQPEEVTAEVSLKKKPKKKPVVDESVDELTIKKAKTVEEEKVEEEIVEEVKIKKKPKKKPSIEETTEEITIIKPVDDTAELKQPEDVTEEISLKKKPKKEPVVDESVDELTIKKPKPVEEEKVEEEIVEEVKIKKKPKKKPSVEEITEEVTITKPVDDTAELKQPEEVTAEVSLKKKSKKKPVVDESVDELTIKKPKPVEEEKVEEEIVEEVKIKKKPKKKPSIEETTEEITITKPVDDTAELQQPEEVTAEVSLKKKPKKKPVVDESVDELTIKKPKPVEEEKVEEEIVEEVKIKKKPKKKPSIEETTEEVTITKPVDDTAELKQPEEVTAEVSLKKKPKKKPVVDESVDELTIKKPQPVEVERVEEEIVEEVKIKKKPKKKPSIEEITDEVTITKPVDETAELQQPEDVTADVSLKKKPKKKPAMDESADELTIEKTVLLEKELDEEIQEFTLKRKPPQMVPKPIEEIYEDVTIKKLRPRKKQRSDIKEVTETETVTFRPRTTKTKEDVEQEFKISLNTYEEEDISMSGKVKLRPKRKKLTYSEETGEETIRIIQQYDDSEPIIEEIIYDSDKDDYSIEELETDELNLPFKRKPKDKRQSYAVEEIEDDVRLTLKSERKYSREETDESLALKLKPKRRYSTYDEEEATLSITKEEDIYEEEFVVRDGDTMFSICSYVAETDEAINLVEGEKVYIIEHTNSDWWFVRKSFTQEKGWVPAQYLLDEAQYTIYLQRKLHEKIDKLPVFEKPAPGDKTSAPRFIEKLQPIHTPDGYTVQFECQVEGLPRPQITWFRQTAIIKPSPDFQMFYDDDNVATLIIKEVFPEDAGTFTCVAKNTAGFASSTTELTVEIPGSDHGSDVTILSRKSLSRESSLADILEGIPPTFSRQPKAKCVKEGDNVILECRLVAVPEPEITWFYNEKKMTNIENVTVATESDMHMYCSVIKITKVLKEQEGKYTIIAKNREGEAVIEIPLKVQTGNTEPPEILEPLKPFAVREGETVVLSTQIVGNPRPSISWLKDGKPLQGVTPVLDGNTSTLTLIQPKISDSGEYSVVATNELGTAETKATLTVEAAAKLDAALALAVEIAKEEYVLLHPIKEMPSGAPEPPLFTERFQELTVPEKGTFKLVAKVIGNPVPEVTWLRNNKPLEKSPNISETYDGENIILEIRNADSEVDAGDYKCVAVNPVGKTSHGARVTVDVDKVSFVKKLERRKTIDEYKTLELTCETSHTVSTTWWHNDKEISGMDHREVIHEGKVNKLVIKRINQTDEGTYKCTVKNQKTFCDVTVKAAKPEFIKKLEDFEVTERQEAILEVEITSQTADVSWSKDGAPLSPSTGKFEFVKEGNIRKLLIRSASIQDEGEYTCSLIDQECTAEVIVVELPPEIITKMQDVTIARGEKATFEIELTKGDALVRWFKDDKELQFSEHIQLSIDGKRQKLKIYNSEPKDAGVYSCKVGDQTSKAKLTVEEPGVEFIRRLPEVTLVPLNEDAVFEIELSNPNIPVKWLRKAEEIHESPKYIIKDEGPIKRLIVKNCTVEDALEYSVLATNVKSSSKLKVEVIEAPPVISMDSPKVYKVKAGEDVEMTVNFTAAPKPTDEWTVNGRVIQQSKRTAPTIDEESATLTIRKVQKDDIGDYTLKLVNVHGEAHINIKLIILQVPSPPGAPEPTKTTNDSVTLQWDEPQFDGDSPITEYILEYHEKNVTIWTKVSEIITETTHTVTKLTTNSEYTFRTKAVNVVGTSEPSPNSKIIKISETKTENKPGPPRGPLEVSGMTKTSFTIKWQPPEDDGGSPITEYIVEMKETSKKTWQKIGSTKEEITYFAVSDLKTDNSYDFKITAKNKIGTGPPYVSEEPIIAGKRLKITKVSEETIYALLGTFPGTKVITCKTPPSPPINVHVTNVTSRSVTLNWSPPLSTGGTELTGYIIEKRPLAGKGSRWTKVITLEATTHSHLIENLKESEFLFRVFAENSLGLSLPTTSEPVLLKSHAMVPSPPTAPLEIRQIAGNTISIGWGRPEYDGGAPLEAYKIAIRDVKKTMWMEVGKVKADIQKLTIRDLQENHEYLFRIYAKNEVGFSEPLESDEPFKIVPASDLTVIEPVAEAPDRGETTSLSFSTENTSSWLREHNMDADIHSYARARLLRRDEYFFRIWHYAKKLFE